MKLKISITPPINPEICSWRGNWGNFEVSQAVDGELPVTQCRQITYSLNNFKKNEKKEKAVPDKTNIFLFALVKSSKNIRSQTDFFSWNFSELSWKLNSFLKFVILNKIVETVWRIFLTICITSLEKVMIRISIISIWFAFFHLRFCWAVDQPY